MRNKNGKNITCKNCDAVFYKSQSKSVQKCCSRECNSKLKIKNGEKECIVCKKYFYKKGVKTCSNKCATLNRSKIFKGRVLSPEWKKKIGKANSVSLLGKTTSKKQRETARKNWTGKNNPRWNGGIKKSYRIRKMQASGHHSKQEWENLKKNYANMCLCCKKFEPEIKLSEDHILPLSLGGSDSIENIQPLCLTCNKKKGTKHIKF